MPFPKAGTNGRMNPDPLLMLMKNMRQGDHGPRPYQGILGAQEEKVVFSEEEAKDWIKTTYQDGQRGTLIRIHVQGIWDMAGGRGLVDDFDQGEAEHLHPVTTKRVAGCKTRIQAKS